MILKHRVEKYYKFSFYNEHVLCWDQCNVLHCLNLNNLTEIWRTTPLEDMLKTSKAFIFNGFYFWAFQSGKRPNTVHRLLKVNIQNGAFEIIENFEFALRYGINETHKKLFHDNKRQVYLLFDLASLSIVWELDSSTIPAIKHVVSDNNLILYRKSSISKVDFLTGILQWQIDLNEINLDCDFKVTSIRVLVIENNQLFLVANNEHIIVVETLTGKIINIISKLPNNSRWNFFNKTRDHFPFLGSALYVPEKKSIINLAFTFYWELNIQSGEVTLINFEEEFKSLKLKAAADEITNSRLVYYKGKLYFISAFEEENTKIKIRKLVAFDIDRRKIGDVYQFDFDNDTRILSSSLFIQERWLRVTDENKVTYIFELDEQVLSAT